MSQLAKDSVVVAAQAGDEAAFAALVEPHRRELQVHCYRMLGSFEDSEDLVQETFLRAWRNRTTFEGRSSFRAWLYRIATNACLDALQRRPREATLHPEAPALAEVPWLQPYPEELLDGVAPSKDEPESEVVAKETIELAFIAAIQLLPPKQRAVLISRDVLGWSAAESAALLNLTVAAVNSALQRARATLKQHLPHRRLDWARDADPSESERRLLERYMEATDRGDVAGMIKVLRQDALCSMPPTPQWWVGAEEIVAAWVEGGFGDPSLGELRCVPTRANRQPAVAVYRRRPGESAFKPFMLDVLKVDEDGVAEVVAFPLEPLVDALGLPPTI